MKTALLVVDVMKGIFRLPVPVLEPDRLLGNVKRLIGHARERGLDVIYLQHLGPPGGPFDPEGDGISIHAEVAPAPGDLVVAKREPDGFVGTELEEVLRKKGVQRLIICGFATEGCVDNTVRGAYRHGFEVMVASDGHSTTDNPHLSAKDVIAYHNWLMGRFGRVVSIQEIIAEP